ncbi:MAG: TonB-dependent receptor [Acidobacteria bacterium]|nr:TonB-dependent receptor [Acidobacteriota bacterium]MCI0720872.1 TonB-dependent receptor [Acidobacteriota bacterium]
MNNALEIIAVSLRKLAILVALQFVLAVSGQAQTAQFVGTVLDPTRAVIPEAEVTAFHVETGIRRRTVTNESGYYTLPSLPTGTYTLQVQKQGFRPVTQSGIKLDIEQVARLDFQLQVGEVTDSIQVEASAPMLQFADSSQGQVIANRQIVELPLNGRNYTQLILLSSGATQPEPGTRGSRSGFSSNGQRSYQNNFLLDGIDNNTNLLAVQSDDFQVIQPNVDAIQEFKVQTNAYGAEYGRGAGAVVNVAIKSGTNAFHGTLFEFLRNDNIEANNFFNNRAGVPRPEFRQNQFGGTLGGPIRKNKAFFFGDYQGTRIRRASTQNSLVPTAPERQGDFSQTFLGGALQTIYDPSTYDPATNMRSPFPQNRIPTNRIDPVAAKLVELYPLPNTPAVGANFISNFPIRDDADQFDVRSDLQVTSQDHLFVRYSYQNRPVFNPPPLPAPAVGGVFSQGARTYTGNSAVLGHTHIFSPTLLSDLRLGYTRIVADWAPTNSEPLNQKFGIKGTQPDLPGLASLGISGYQSLGDPGFLPNITKANNYELSGALHWNKSRHDVALGANGRHVQSTLFTTPQTRGQFGFTGNFTRQTSPLTAGNGLADFLLGIPTGSTISGTAQGFYLRSPLALYIQDNWRLSSRLALNLGLRYERAPFYHERYGNIGNLFLPGAGGAGVPRLLTPRDPGVPGSSLVSVDNTNFAPRLGFAYELSSKMVLRGAYGIFYGAEEQVGGGSMLHNNPPFNTRSDFATNNLVPNLLLSTGFPLGAVPQRPRLIVMSEDFPSPYSQQWNVTIERQLAGELVVSAAYVGSASAHVYHGNEINAPPPGPGNVNDRRPIDRVDFPVFGVIPVGAIFRTEPRGLANYHSLQLRAEKRYTSGLFLLGSWIYSKAIDLSGDLYGDGASGGINNNSDIRAERGRASFDVRHRAVVSYGYELPFGKGRALAKALPAAVDHLVGGWQIQGITTFRSGLPFTVSATGNASNTQSGDRPDLIGDPHLPSEQRSIDRWFDSAAFRRQAQFTFGNAGRNILSGPRLANFDFSLFKNFVLRESVTVQFRSEVFNLMNSAHFGQPGATLGTAPFGRIQSTVAPPRQFQFALKLLF